MQLHYTFDSARIFSLLVRIVVFLLVMNGLVIAAEYFFKNSSGSFLDRKSYLLDIYLPGLFNFDSEKNIPSCFSSILLLAGAALLWVVARTKKLAQQPWHRQWQLLSYVFLFLALDELLSLHEQLINPARLVLQRLTASEKLGLLNYAWVMPYGLALLLLGACLRKFFFRLPAQVRYSFLLAGGIYLFGALVLEMAGGYLEKPLGGQLSLPYRLIVTAEETLEMLGIIFFIRALLRYLQTLQPVPRVLFLFSEKEDDRATTFIIKEKVERT